VFFILFSNSVEKYGLEGEFNMLHDSLSFNQNLMDSAKSTDIPSTLKEISETRVELQEMYEKMYQVSDLHWYLNSMFIMLDIFYF